MSEWKSTQYPGIRYREHETRKHHGKPDRYFAIRYKRQGKTNEEGAGWSSQKMNAQKANGIRSDIVQNIREGKHPQSLKEKRQVAENLIKTQENQRLQEVKSQFTFGQLASQYIDWAKSNKVSWADDERRYRNHLAPFLADMQLKDISPFHLEKLKKDLSSKKLSPATIKHCLVLIRQMFNKANAWELSHVPNPIAKVKLPKLNNKRLRFLSHEEAASLLNELTTRSDQVYLQALLSLQCGLRFGEIAGLTWDDLDFENEIIHIRSSKSGESHQAFMTNEVKNNFLKRKKDKFKKTDLLLPDQNGKRQTKISHAFHRTVDRLGFNNGINDKIQHVVFHTLRHTFASWLAINGTPLYTIKELMGHKTLAMTERYAHLFPDHKKQAVTDMAEVFRKAQTNEKTVPTKKEVKHG